MQSVAGCAAVVALAWAGQASAIPGPILPGAVVTQSITLFGEAPILVTSSLSPVPPGIVAFNADSDRATSGLLVEFSDPSLFALASAGPASQAPAFASVTLAYSVYIQDNNPAALTTVMIDVADILDGSNDGGADAYMTVTNPLAPFDQPYARIACLALNCLRVTTAPVGSLGTLGVSQAIQMYTNTIYDVFLAVDVTSGAGGLGIGRLDPTFTVGPGSGQTVFFSPGVAPAASVPEPAVWTMMMLGAALVGLSSRRGRSRSRACHISV